MKGYKYKLTERGNVAIALILAVLIFVVPAIIFMYMAWNGGAYYADGPNISMAQPAPETAPDTDDNDTPNNGDDPLQNNNDAYPPDSEDVDNDDSDPAVLDDDDQDLNNDDDTAQNDLPGNETISVELNNGTMRFWLSQPSQDIITPDVASAIDDFLTSPRNTYHSQIVVDLPDLPESERVSLVTAITDAFAEHNVAQGDLLFEPYQINEGVDGVFEIRFHFSTPASTPTSPPGSATTPAIPPSNRK